MSEKPVILVVGARPNFMKIAPLYAELKHRGLRPLIRPLYRHRKWLDSTTPAPAEDEWEFQGFEEILEVSIRTRPLKSTKKENV